MRSNLCDAQVPGLIHFTEHFWLQKIKGAREERWAFLQNKKRVWFQAKFSTGSKGVIALRRVRLINSPLLLLP